MKFISKVLLTFLMCSPAIAATSGELTYENDPNCAVETAKNSQLRENDFIWTYTIDLMLQTFERIYDNEEKRLPARAYWSAEKKSLMLPYLSERGGAVAVSAKFVENLKNHIESAFAKKYIDAVFFPDMGHSHFLIPNKLWDAKYDKYAVSEFSKMYQDLFNDSHLKVLYHTAEQLKTLDEDKNVIDDPKIKWRHHTRNIVGLNNGSNELLVLQNPDSKANTVNEYKDHFWYGAGYNISSNKNGCLSYKKDGRTYRFDLSLFDLQ